MRLPRVIGVRRSRRELVAGYRARHPERCKAQVAAYRERAKPQCRAYQKKYRNSPKFTETNKKRLEKYYMLRPELNLLRLAKCRAKKRGIPFGITETDIKVPEFCPVLGMRLESGFGKGRVRPDSVPSLDRIERAKGYVPGNVWVISWRANKLKNDGTLEEFERLVAAIKKQVSHGN